MEETAAASTQKFAFKAGRMRLNGKILSPDSQKGLLTFDAATLRDDNLIIVRWTSREGETAEDVRMMVPCPHTL